MQLNPGYYDLCIDKIEYLRPRWYGSTKAMIDFGWECTTNVNWTGAVRLMLADAHYEVSREIRDNDERQAFWRQPEVWSDIRFAFEQFFKLYPKEIGYRHNYARYAARCGQGQEFLNQAKQFPSTNHAFFGGEATFNTMLQTAVQQAKKN
jgi:hypothetical protein